jgi:hypothetical protein
MGLHINSSADNCGREDKLKKKAIKQGESNVVYPTLEL